MVAVLWAGAFFGLFYLYVSPHMAPPSLKIEGVAHFDFDKLYHLLTHAGLLALPLAIVPDRRIAWRSTSGDAPNGGSVQFEPLGADRTRVRLAMEYEPQGMAEKAGDAVGILSSRVQNDVENFKKYIESRGAESGGWRGEVRGGQKTR